MTVITAQVMAKALELLSKLQAHVEVHDEDGFVDCPCCVAGGWGLAEHEKDCPVREARSILGLCPHGYKPKPGEGCGVGRDCHGPEEYSGA